MDALRLAAAQCRGKAVEGEVFKPNRVEKVEPLANFFQNRPSNLVLHWREVNGAEEFLGLSDGQRGGLADVQAAQADAASFGPQALAAAIRTLGIAAILAEHHAHVQLVSLPLHLREEAVDAGKAALAAQHGFARGFGKVAPGHVERHAQLRRMLLQIGEPGPALGPVPGVDRAVIEAQALVGNHQVQVEVHRVAKALAARTGAEGIVEAEQARLRLAAGAMAALALVQSGKAMARTGGGFVARELFKGHLAGLAVGDLRGIYYAGAILGAHDNAVQQNKNRKRKVEVKQRLGRGELEDAASLIKAIEARAAQLDQPRLQRFSQRRFGCSLGRGPKCGFARGFQRAANRLGFRLRRGLGRGPPERAH